MKGRLNKQQLEYIYFHINQHIFLTSEITSFFIYGSNNKNEQKKIIFKSSTKALNENNIVFINEIPVLFPCSDKKQFYTIENNNLIFHHDILKSAFYLLSGYQEFVTKEKDSFGRYPYNLSIQKKLNITDKPIVNYYFKIIADAIVEFLKPRNIEVKQKKPFNNFVFFLTHDIDNIYTYTFSKLLYKIKEITYLVDTEYSFSTNFKLFFKILFELLKFNKKANPAWSFKYLRKLESMFNFRSAFYFLEKHEKNLNSNYYFHEKKMTDLFSFLTKEKCEIGLHGTRKSFLNEKELLRTLTHLNKVIPHTAKGIRQHRLLYELPKTALIHENSDLIYDTTLAFAEHEGFRNSYCYPFKLYDFEKDRIINVWEIPLTVMDGTLFYYRKLSLKEANSAIEKILTEIITFNGIFTLLWHNDFFDEDRYPGVTQFYEVLLKKIHSLHPENLLGFEIIHRCSTN